MQNTNNNFQPAMRTKPAQISCQVLWDALFSYALWKHPMQSCRIRHFNLTIKLFWFHCALFFLKKLFDPSSVAMEKSWTIIGDEDDKSKTVANYSNVWCVVQTCTYNTYPNYGSIRRLKKFMNHDVILVLKSHSLYQMLSSRGEAGIWKFHWGDYNIML